MNDTYKKLGLNIDYPVKIVTEMDFDGNGRTIILQEYGNKAEDQTIQSKSLRAANSLIENYFSTKDNKTTHEKFMQVLPILNNIAQIVRIDLGYEYPRSNKELFKDLIDWNVDWNADWIEEDEDNDDI
ncbi:hypothetical protein [Paenibacillus piri]|uniref:Uncharacterized protein n=1 Tax=Paenibacillus piri TaxID=2547395 RepID=A0A4R5KNS0_9BACL|nr:hypothetical protein [Paenibacillus piri]TDF96595.1 hypothetical protein E1757_15985 [Paenibacillus piri]